MEAIHLKTIDPVAQALLRQADRQGLELTWERFEAQQPQDGFLRTGLFCPFGCLHGPCRIDPFGRGAQRGICGVGRDAMVAASLLRLCLDAAVAAGNADGITVEAAAMLRRPSVDTAKMVAQAVTLCTLATEKAQDVEASGDFDAGYGLLADAGATVAIAGMVSQETAKDLGAGAKVVSLGGWLSDGAAILPIACTTGEAETALVSKRIHVLFAGDGTDPGLVALAEKLGIPVARDAAEAVEAAKRGAGMSAGIDVDIEANAVGTNRAFLGTKAVAAATKDMTGRVALLGGFDTPHQPQGWIPTEVAPCLMADGIAVAAWGDAAVWLAKAGLAGSDQPNPALLVGPEGGARDVVQAVGVERIAGACFAAPRDSRDIAAAVALAAMGVDVMVTTPLPIWGSPAVMEALDDAVAGSIHLVDKPAGADEVLAWFRDLAT